MLSIRQLQCCRHLSNLMMARFRAGTNDTTKLTWQLRIRTWKCSHFPGSDCTIPPGYNGTFKVYWNFSHVSTELCLLYMSLSDMERKRRRKSISPKREVSCKPIIVIVLRLSYLVSVLSLVDFVKQIPASARGSAVGLSVGRLRQRPVAAPDSRIQIVVRVRVYSPAMQRTRKFTHIVVDLQISHGNESGRGRRPCPEI